MPGVPEVVGQTQTAAETSIIGAGLSVGKITRQSSDTVPVDTVISQELTAGSPPLAPGQSSSLQ